MNYDLDKYKKAKQYVKQLTNLLSIFKESSDKLEMYKNFIPAQECYNTLQSNIVLIELHLVHQQKILDTKAKNEL